MLCFFILYLSGNVQYFFVVVVFARCLSNVCVIVTHRHSHCKPWMRKRTQKKQNIDSVQICLSSYSEHWNHNHIHRKKRKILSFGIWIVLTAKNSGMNSRHIRATAKSWNSQINWDRCFECLCFCVHVQSPHWKSLFIFADISKCRCHRSCNGVHHTVFDLSFDNALISTLMLMLSKPFNIWSHNIP